jgi:hypothetical protein
MDKDHTDQIPADLVSIVERLEQDRTTATPLELDTLKRRARRQAGRTARSQMKGQFLKSRIAIVSVLALGVFMSGAGATLAVSGSSGSGNASTAEYGKVAPQQQTGQTGNGPENSLAGADQGQAQTQPQAGAATGNDQVAATTSSKSLPFTGLAAIPLLLLGLGLLGGGLFMRRSARRA